MTPVYMSVPDAAKYTGLAACFIRKGIKAGTIPAIVAGRKYLVNIPLTLEALNAQSEARKAGGNG